MQTRKLTPEQHRIMVGEHGTERPGSSPLNYAAADRPFHVRHIAARNCSIPIPEI